MEEIWWEAAWGKYRFRAAVGDISFIYFLHISLAAGRYFGKSLRLLKSRVGIPLRRSEAFHPPTARGPDIQLFPRWREAAATWFGALEVDRMYAFVQVNAKKPSCRNFATKFAVKLNESLVSAKRHGAADVT